jgi:hypothetical protein
MKTLLVNTSFSKSLFAGLLTGIIAALLNLVYMIIYRESTNFARDLIVMPLTIFIGFPILLSMSGSAYFLLQKHLRSGATWFVIICLIGMIALLLVTIRETSLNHGSLITGARGLFLGMELITFFLAAFLIPYLAKHSRIYS